MIPVNIWTWCEYTNCNDYLLNYNSVNIQVGIKTMFTTNSFILFYYIVLFCEKIVDAKMNLDLLTRSTLIVDEKWEFNFKKSETVL